MTTFKVVIPTAGLGSRVGPYSKFMNKALVTIGSKPSLIRIIEQFDQDTEIVIILGYRGEQIRQVVKAFFPDRKITFETVDKFDGEGSGLGYTLKCAKRHLMCPFIFISNDTICGDVSSHLNPALYGNWLAYYKKKKGDQINLEQYRTISHSGGMLTNILPKGIQNEDVYIGLCGVADYTEFWRLMEDDQAIEVGESLALKSLDQVKTVAFDEWNDIGNMVGIQKAKNQFKMNDVNILEKEDEAIWFTDGRVIKFHINEDFIADRVARQKFLGRDIVPQITHHDENLYVYDKQPGVVLSKSITKGATVGLLDLAEKEMWQVRPSEVLDVKGPLDDFYRVKTVARIKHFLDRFEFRDNAVEINGQSCPPSLAQVELIDWQKVYESAQIGRFHGDFHSENILYGENGFKFLDWRQNFGELGKEFGDVYYDLAKFLHGLIVSHEMVDNGGFRVEKLSDDKVFIDIHRPFVNVEAEKVFFDWCTRHNYDVEHVKLLTALIYLNICGLHEYPYSEFLFYLGRYLLQLSISE